MGDIKREIYEQDAIEAKQDQAYIERMEARGYVRCKECDEWVKEEDLSHGLCEQCIKDIIENTTLEEVMEYASTLENDTEDSELILYTQYLFTREQAIEILKKEAMKIKSDFLFRKEITNYIANDTSHYIDYLEEKGDL